MCQPTLAFQDLASVIGREFTSPSEFEHHVKSVLPFRPGQRKLLSATMRIALSSPSFLEVVPDRREISERTQTTATTLLITEFFLSNFLGQEIFCHGI